MTQIAWTKSSIDDLHSIHAYIARDSLQYAGFEVERIRRAVERLRQFPLLGAVVPEWRQPDVREVLSGNYRVIYMVGDDRVDVLNVIHAARQMPSDPPSP